ncbi:hypothetical protein Poli38472_000535 [Pythium oligandrum]|uniref:Uncharacterized protein n=1 Tax=Pythium oligandrum TaxID=41045 RepID=A0A8K1FJ83_PYTOL|nr:hypothetical protein Poli38472_000535 [Pythium oligandrum]|eukprot:TMW60493.1 hypothetical protein Poli38472_000535 [Pythium oligandrum]
MMMHRRLQQRQRFDSADWALTLHHQKQLTAVPAPLHRSDSDDFSDWVQCEYEPEPEGEEGLEEMVHKHQAPVEAALRMEMPQVQRVPLQRFDSADWAMQCHLRRPAANEVGSSTHHTSSGHHHRDILSAPIAAAANAPLAKVLLDRHAFKMSPIVNSSVESPKQAPANA